MRIQFGKELINFHISSTALCLAAQRVGVQLPRVHYENGQKAKDLAREAIGWNGGLDRYWFSPDGIGVTGRSRAHWSPANPIAITSMVSTPTG